MKRWLWQIRGLAIIAVVVCHQQGFLHTSDLIQILTLYSVTTLVFLMGYTSALSIKRKNTYIVEYGCLRYSLKLIQLVLCAYILGTLGYLIYQKDLSLINLLSNMVNFSATPPFYFFNYYFLYSLIAPAMLAFLVLKVHVNSAHTATLARTFSHSVTGY